MRDFKRAALALTAVGVVTMYGAALAYPVDRPERAAAGWISFPEIRFAARAVDALDGAGDAMFAARSVDGLRDAFDSIAFELKSIRHGDQRVPRVFLARLPYDFDRRMVIDQRKRAFVKAVLPLLLKANEEIVGERRHLVALEERLSSGLELPEESQRWLAALSDRYGAAEGDFATLLRRVDAVSPALALAQAIEESGWGRSRFARDGNALFGQRAWQRGSGLVPTARGEEQVFEVRAFDTLLDSVRSYARNLNTHPAYADYRVARAEMRAGVTALDPFTLADSLAFYSERREAYVEALKALIRSNRLEQFETAQLDTVPAAPDGIQIAQR